MRKEINIFLIYLKAAAGLRDGAMANAILGPVGSITKADEGTAESDPGIVFV